MLDLPQFADLMRPAIAVFMENEPGLRPFRNDGSLEAFSASYDLKTFDAIDDRFMQLTETVEPSTALQSWLAGRLSDLVVALADV